MKQAVLTQKETILFSEIEKPVISETEVLIKVKYIGICGSDIHAYYGKHPFISFPIRLGHEMSGEILETGNAVKNFRRGDLVTIMPQQFCGHCEPCRSGRYNICETLKVIGCQLPGAACEYFKAEASVLKKIPEGMSARIAATIEPAAVGVHAVRRCGSIKGKNVVVIGAGTIGNVTAQAALAEGAKDVLITDLSDYRLGLAKDCGIIHTVNTGRISMEKAVEQAFAGKGADIFLECVGLGDTLNQAIACSKRGCDIVVVGVYGYEPQLTMSWVQKRELRITGSQMYVERDFQDAIDYIEASKMKMEPLISKIFSFEKYGEAYKYIEKNRDISLKILIKMQDG